MDVKCSRHHFIWSASLWSLGGVFIIIHVFSQAREGRGKLDKGNSLG